MGDSELYLFYILLPLVAFMYASVGHGGASGYLALMALFSFPTAVMKPNALLLNLVVAAVAFISFSRSGHFRWKLFYPFAIASIPAAFIGGLINPDPWWYKKILGVLLIFAVLRILGVFGKNITEIKQLQLPKGLFTGGLIGFFSGLIGIGGGIILSPLILIFRWGTLKEAAAVSALFIWVNSASGMAGLLSSGASIPTEAFSMAGLALIGGIAGGYMGSHKFNGVLLKQMLGLVLAIASIKLLVI